MLGLGFSITKTAVLQRLLAPAAPLPEPRLALIGDSLTVGGAMQAWAVTRTGQGLVYQVIAQGGRSVGSPANLNDGGNSAYGHFAEIVAFAPKAANILFGANDMGLFTGPQHLSNLQQFCTDLRSAIPGIYLTVCTNQPISPDYAAPAYNDFEARRQEVRTGLYAAEGTWFNRLIDLGGHSLTSAPGAAGNFVSGAWTSRWYPDGIHMANEAYANATAQVGAVLDGVFGFTTGNAPAGFSLPDLTDVLRNANVTSEYVVRGLAEGSTLSATRTGAGTLRRNLEAAGTGPISGIRNGDVIQALQTASNLNNVKTTQTVTLGGASDNFEVTTVATDPVPAAAFNPSDKSIYASLSNSNRTITGDAGTGAPQLARGVTSRATGKYYFEMTSGPSGSGDFLAGLMAGATPIANAFPLPGGTGGGPGFSVTGFGNVYFDGQYRTDILVNSTTGYNWFGQTTGYAVDFDAGKVWFRRHTGEWGSYEAIGNPETGAGGFTVAALGSPLFFFGGCRQNYPVTVNAGQVPFVMPKPNGFGLWPAA